MTKKEQKKDSNQITALDDEELQSVNGGIINLPPRLFQCPACGSHMYYHYGPAPLPRCNYRETFVCGDCGKFFAVELSADKTTWIIL